MKKLRLWGTLAARATRHMLSMGAVMALSAGVNAQSTMSPPSVQYLDKFGVNMMNGQVNTTLDTISIGGAMGLSHSISMYTNHFLRAGQKGYTDKYYGSAVYSQLLGPGFVWPIMRVSDFSGSVDFKVMTGGSVYTGNGDDPPFAVNYLALKDTRNTLVVAGAANEFLDWTKPDGTVTRFHRTQYPSVMVRSTGSVVQVTFPNGFTVNQDFLRTVWTNTGFSLVYQHEPDMRPPDYASDANAPAGAPLYSIAEWALHNPRRVKAVNNAACSTGSAACMQRSWPTVTFNWPRGMPRTMYIGNRDFSVETPLGTTTYTYQPYDLAMDGNVVVDGYTAGQRLSPRLFKIKPASSALPILTYTYKNLWVYTSVGLRDDMFGVEWTPSTGTFPMGMGGYATLVQDAGVIETAQLLEESSNYEIGQLYQGEGSAHNRGSLVGKVYQVIMNISALPAAVSQVVSVDSRVFFETSSRNFPWQIWRNGPIDELGYTSRGNLQTIHTNGVVMSRAIYENENACSTLPKICNQATSIFDAKNNETKFVYHAESGQISRIIPPADQNGKVAETRFDYQQLRARYFDSSGNRIEGSPIYMKVAERRCHDSNYASAAPTATCSGGDEVITRYYYSHNNLLLTSVATTAPNGKTLRTCFQYDAYGNKLGETQPKGAVNCN
jgi:hypothetical protein